jgi:uncharacterized protein YdeI (YjbR/CyaY-like superfamily)
MTKFRTHVEPPEPMRGLEVPPEVVETLVETGDEVELELDTEPRVVVEPEDFARALDADPVARTAYDRLSHSRKRQHVLAIDSAKKPETRIRRIEKALATLRDQQSA